MPDVLRRCWLYSAHQQRCIVAALCWLPAGSGISRPVRGALLFLSEVVVVVPAGLGILRCWWWVPDFVQRLCFCGVVVVTVMVHYGLLPLDFSQWMEQVRPMGVNVGVAMVVHAVVLPAILRN